MNTQKPLITKAAIDRLIGAAIQVKLMNGCFNVASVAAQFSRHRFELTVEVTHPRLVWQCGDKKETALVFWKGSTGHLLNIPDVLMPLIERMRVEATMTDEEAERISKGNLAAFEAACAELGM